MHDIEDVIDKIKLNAADTNHKNSLCIFSLRFKFRHIL